ncbi:hypothetical protein MOC27_15145 [Bacillus inaquosorum]|uniref:hypothetical protein n=2 Tax=Bacillus inaquosorum TaxID=483913 RepID=UPI00227FE7D9|nr:hypothetical protein [Bacillus inaquosorum]MCY7943376.1 hypothetical protein [Bacillus inaquosorum]MCY8246464.1 hypothetical protein [Bacillus inaquosorum]MCY8251052.1 hypothetical protein [Bacillus inaquosorum]MCY8296211.1 hypothetical protein [Bacillus inaquosorum]MCY8708733.1 hypothetical protein [Bacillus inaquosorum]
MNENIIPINRHTQEMPNNGSMIENSGNSEVHIDIHIDTMPIAFAILCSALAAKQMSKEEFDMAYTRLQEMNREHNNNTSVKQIINQEIEE